MRLDIDQSRFGFRLSRSEFVSELNSTALLFQHEATGAELMVLENDDDNKVFSATFRTPPSNDAGVAHILEHSVLCGSHKYPIKEPFMELMKGSLKTFLNAMTFPDKTMYPVASRNQKDLFNLMDVYLDAVFFPRITREIFMQEGWHHELENLDGEIVRKGVVFNEMKGVFSDPESLLERHINHSLFPNTTYGYESGGDPKQIPKLSYEEFKEFHATYYHPSNCRLFLYGDGDTEKYLRFINENYLSEFNRKQIDSVITCQAKFSEPRREIVKYPIAQSESDEKKTYVLLGMILDRATDQEHCMAFNILSHLLVGTPASPLRKALIDSGLGSELVGGGFDDQRLETVFTIGMKGTEVKHETEVLNLIFQTLKNLVENGIDENMTAAAVNTVDFKLREANFGGFAKGIVYNIQALGSWLYDADPLMHLRYEVLMGKIRDESKKGYFEDLIKRYLLDNPHRSVIVGVPHAGLSEEQERADKEGLAKFKVSLNEEETKCIAEETKTLQRLQTEPDSPEALATLPRLEISDLGSDVPCFPIDIKNGSSPEFFYNDLFTNKIGYVQVGFNVDSVSLEDVPYLPLLGKLILEMGTKRNDYVSLLQRIGIHTGGIRASHFSSLPLDYRDRILSYVFFNGKATLDKLDELFGLYGELLGEYEFNDSRRLVEILRSAKADMESSLVPSGNHYVLSRLQSYYSRIGLYDEIAGGIAYFEFLRNLLERAEKNADEVASCFRRVAKKTFTKNNMLVNVTSEAKNYKSFEQKVFDLAERFPVKSSKPTSFQFKKPVTNEAFPTASTVQYVGKGANLYDLGFEYSGGFEVVKAMLNTSYLWENIRMRGGAYGCSASFDYYSGDFGLVSYRDPNLKETLDSYDAIPNFLEQLNLPGEELTKFIIGCVGRLDPPLTPDRKGWISMVDRLTGMNYERRKLRREQILETTEQDVRGFASLFREISRSGSVCVLGGEEKIKENSNLFNKLVHVFE